MMGENPGTFSGARENGEGGRLAKAEIRRLALEHLFACYCRDLQISCAC